MTAANSSAASAEDVRTGADARATRRATQAEGSRRRSRRRSAVSARWLAPSTRASSTSGRGPATPTRHTARRMGSTEFVAAAVCSVPRTIRSRRSQAGERLGRADRPLHDDCLARVKRLQRCQQRRIALGGRLGPQDAGPGRVRAREPDRGASRLHAPPGRRGGRGSPPRAARASDRRAPRHAEVVNDAGGVGADFKLTERVTTSRSGKRGRRPWTLRSAAVIWPGSTLRGKVSRKVSRRRAASAAKDDPEGEQRPRPECRDQHDGEEVSHRCSSVCCESFFCRLLLGFHPGERERHEGGDEPLQVGRIAAFGDEMKGSVMGVGIALVAYAQRIALQCVAYAQRVQASKQEIGVPAPVHD